MIELTINLIHKFELILFMAVDFIDETMFKTYFFCKKIQIWDKLLKISHRFRLQNTIGND